MCKLIVASTRCFRETLAALIAPNFRSKYMKLPPNEVPERIRNDPKLYPFFMDCHGAIDGTHISVHPPAPTRARWRDRHGQLTQNILAICDFTMRFIFLLVG